MNPAQRRNTHRHGPGGHGNLRPTASRSASSSYSSGRARLVPDVPPEHPGDRHPLPTVDTRIHSEPQSTHDTQRAAVAAGRQPTQGHTPSALHGHSRSPFTISSSVRRAADALTPTPPRSPLRQLLQPSQLHRPCHGTRHALENSGGYQSFPVAASLRPAAPNPPDNRPAFRDAANGLDANGRLLGHAPKLYGTASVWPAVGQRESAAHDSIVRYTAQQNQCRLFAS